MEFHVVAVGKIRHAGSRGLCEEFARRARRYAPLTVHEVTESRGRRQPHEALRAEAEALLRAWPDAARGVALTRSGRALDSTAFAKQVGRWREDARDVCFLIGGAFGLDASLLERADDALSLSPMTLPHELARVVLLEQLYRAHSILRGEPYHKGA